MFVQQKQNLSDFGHKKMNSFSVEFLVLGYIVIKGHATFSRLLFDFFYWSFENIVDEKILAINFNDKI